MTTTAAAVQFRSYWLEFFRTPWTPEGEALVRDRAWKYAYGGTGAANQAERDEFAIAALFCRVSGIRMSHYHPQEGACGPKK
jgi:hypothetical protein